MLNFINAIIIIAKAVPKVKEILDQLVDLYTDWQINQYRQQATHQQIKTRSLLRAIKNAKTDQERIALSIVLHNINKL
jgi:hypothetical protein